MRGRCIEPTSSLHREVQPSFTDSAILGCWRPASYFVMYATQEASSYYLPVTFGALQKCLMQPSATAALRIQAAVCSCQH